MTTLQRFHLPKATQTGQQLSLKSPPPAQGDGICLSHVGVTKVNVDFKIKTNLQALTANQGCHRENSSNTPPFLKHTSFQPKLPTIPPRTLFSQQSQNGHGGVVPYFSHSCLLSSRTYFSPRDLNEAVGPRSCYTSQGGHIPWWV